MESTNSHLQTIWRQFNLQQKAALLSQAKSIRKGLNDSCFFARYFLGIDLNPFQERVLGELDRDLKARRGTSKLLEYLLHAGNRSGKTVLLAVLHIKFAYYKIGIRYGPGYDEFRYRTFNLSPMSRQAKECIRYIEDILKGRFTWEKDKVRHSNYQNLKLKDFFEDKNETLGELRYSNRSITYSFSTGEDMGAGFQGLPAGLMTYDEAVLSHHLEEELPSNVYSRLGDYGCLMMLIGTPQENAKSQQYFYHITQQALAKENEFKVLSGNYEENVFISEEKRLAHAEEVKKRDPGLAEQILHGGFVTTGGVMFEHAVIEHLWQLGKDLLPPNPDREYLISVDWGLAEKGDETVMLVWDSTDLPIRVVYAYSKQGGDPYELMAVLRNLKIEYNNAKVVMDTSSMGGTILKKLLRDLKPIPFEAAGSGEVKENALFYTQVLLTKNRKRRMVENRWVEDNPDYGWIRSVYLPKLAVQLATYKLDDTKLKTDWVSAFYMGCYILFKKFGENPLQQKSFPLSRFRTRVSPSGKVIQT